MPNDNLFFPRRFIGYGAYNLCFDKKLGEWPDKDANGKTVMRNFFEYIRARPAFNAINLVRVICFRTSTLEGLPAVQYEASGKVKETSRTQPLFRRNGATDLETNEHFLTNLLNLVRTAKEHQFWVQVCIFHEHAVKETNGSFEMPENAPSILDTRSLADNCARLSTFFNISSTPQGQTRLARQQRLVYEIASTLRWETNVLFEIANEVRIDGCGGDLGGTRNCALVPWLQTMADYVLSGIFWDHDPSGSSTGANNEQHIFSPTRPPGCANVPQPWRPVYYDFHTVQWGIPINDIHSSGYIDGIPRAKANATTYNQGRPPFLIINDDGAKFGDELTAAEKQDHARLIKEWAKTAFTNGLHYASKQQYPPVGWDMPALNALAEANTAAPLP